MTVGELGCDLDPFPAFGADHVRFTFQLLGNEAIDERDVLKPATVIALKKVVQNDAARLFIDVEADELCPLVGGAPRLRLACGG